MEKTLMDASVVVVARGFNVPLFSQLWLRRKKIFSEKELTGAIPLFTPAVAQVETTDCVLSVQQERLQMRIKNLESDALRKIKRIIEALPECPYTGLGFNFRWGITSFVEDVSAVSRKNFLPTSRQNPWCSEFKKDSSVSVGAFYCKKLHDSVMNLEIRPQIITIGVGEEQASKDSMVFSFNFHYGITSPLSKEKWERMFDTWEEKYKESERIASLFRE